MKRTVVLALGLLTFVVATQAHAIPALQIYVEGATYDMDTESWTSSLTDFNIWVIGNVGAYGIIEDVHLAMAFDTAETGGTVTLTPTTATMIADPTAPSVPTDEHLSEDGEIPLMLSGSELPSHGVYGVGRSFTRWHLGDMDLTDSPIGDFSGTFPGSFPEDGQINAYRVQLDGFGAVHFDTYNHVAGEKKSRYYFGPFSHDAEGGHTEERPDTIPEPASVWMFGMILAGLAMGRARRRTRP